MALALFLSFATLLPPHAAFGLSTNTPRPALLRRRDLLCGGLATIATSTLPTAAPAFDNATPEAAQYADRPKRRGPPPTDLGLKKRQLNQYGDTSESPELKLCKGAPNCFSTSGDPEFDAASIIEPWVPPSSLSKAAVAEALSEALASYKPGQGGIDGAGFKFVTRDTQSGYFQVQYESLKNGYIDDLELAVVEKGSGLQVLVRSSSRVGFLDFGVNAKRLNAIGSALGKAGWTAKEITPKTHGDYFAQNYGR